MAVRDNIDIGVCQIFWTPDGGSEIELGLTAEGVTIDIEGESFEIVPHELGVMIDAVQDTMSITSDIQLIECNDDNVATGLGALKTTQAGPPEVTSIDISPIRGDYLPFGKLVFHPRRLPSADKSKDVTIWKAMVQRQGQQIFRANQNGTVSFSIKAAAVEDPDTGEWKVYTRGDTTTDVTFPL